MTSLSKSFFRQHFRESIHVACGARVSRLDVARLRKRAHYESYGGHMCYGTEDVPGDLILIT